jgi:hypothetical protein
VSIFQGLPSVNAGWPIFAGPRNNGGRLPDHPNVDSPDGGAAVASQQLNVRFSNRPFGVKHFQAIRRCSVDVAHGLVLLFGIGTKALPSWDSKTRWNNLRVGLAVKRNGRSKRTCELTSSIVPRGTSFHRSVELEVSSYWI